MLYPVVANANQAVREELLELVGLRGDAILACILSPSDRVSASELIGRLDPKQQHTFELVLERGETDASELMRDFGQSEGLQHTTAWNNRLASLVALGVILEVSNGRAKRYRPVLVGA
jgi:hypothetical protein